MPSTLQSAVVCLLSFGLIAFSKAQPPAAPNYVYYSSDIDYTDEYIGYIYGGQASASDPECRYICDYRTECAGYMLRGDGTCIAIMNTNGGQPFPGTYTYLKQIIGFSTPNTPYTPDANFIYPIPNYNVIPGVTFNTNDFAFFRTTNIADCEALCNIFVAKCSLFVWTQSSNYCYLKQEPNNAPFLGPVAGVPQDSYIKIANIPTFGGVTENWCLSRGGAIVGGLCQVWNMPQYRQAKFNIIPPGQPIDPGAAEGWTILNGRAVKLVGKSSNWFDAMLDASTYQGELAFPTGAAEMIQLYNALGTSIGPGLIAYVGADDLNTADQFQSSTSYGGNAAASYDFVTGGPDNGFGYDCLELYGSEGGKGNIINCFFVRDFYIVERRLLQITTTTSVTTTQTSTTQSTTTSATTTKPTTTSTQTSTITTKTSTTVPTTTSTQTTTATQTTTQTPLPTTTQTTTQTPSPTTTQTTTQTPLPTTTQTTTQTPLPTTTQTTTQTPLPTTTQTPTVGNTPPPPATTTGPLPESTQGSTVPQTGITTLPAPPPVSQPGTTTLPPSVPPVPQPGTTTFPPPVSPVVPTQTQSAILVLPPVERPITTPIPPILLSTVDTIAPSSSLIVPSGTPQPSITISTPAGTATPPPFRDAVPSQTLTITSTAVAVDSASSTSSGRPSPAVIAGATVGALAGAALLGFGAIAVKGGFFGTGSYTVLATTGAAAGMGGATAAGAGAGAAASGVGGAGVTAGAGGVTNAAVIAGGFSPVALAAVASGDAAIGAATGTSVITGVGKSLAGGGVSTTFSAGTATGVAVPSAAAAYVVGTGVGLGGAQATTTSAAAVGMQGAGITANVPASGMSGAGSVGNTGSGSGQGVGSNRGNIGGAGTVGNVGPTQGFGVGANTGPVSGMGTGANISGMGQTGGTLPGLGVESSGDGLNIWPIVASIWAGGQAGGGVAAALEEGQVLLPASKRDDDDDDK
ncbi:hypothetical protein M427DRAFT_151733 [Gonapodya prolifera JEL478]|uniref:Apple domain-containing protein n=1 Tax=Gonapodya prolifera (strain JEL478) TaxID=1344416 RepID=A0A139AWF1_GONPJ|nr:hypothetical protein M427DRAFT_151733 [Gonapodya prolifera JEL478]|eukprot:KXS21050.1 hypothetical protein M427DRAFT_151733 [Gonapodya prolifera JEL478]